MHPLTKPWSRRVVVACGTLLAFAGWSALSTLAQPSIVQPAAAPPAESPPVATSPATAPGPATAATTRAASRKPTDPSAPLVAAGFAFMGSGSCGAGVCHGGPVPEKPEAAARLVPAAYSLWNAPEKPDAPVDPHRGAFKSLRSAEAKAIARKLGIEAPTADASCLACHAANVPADLKGAGGFSLGEGVSCNVCHGPAGQSVKDPANRGWAAVHNVGGWVAKQRVAYANDPGGLLKATGFNDLRPAAERSRLCVGCHVGIDPKAVAAGHSLLTFEMHWASATYPNRHWNDPADNYFAARLWAAGQVEALAAAMRRLADTAGGVGVADPGRGADAGEVAAAYAQAMSHLETLAPLFGPGLLPAPTFNVVRDQAAAALHAAADPKAVADPAKRADVAQAAAAAATAAARLAPVVAGWEPTKESVAKVLSAQLAEPLTMYGGFGVDQQRKAVYALFKSTADGPDKPADADKTLEFIGEKLFADPPGEPPRPAGPAPAGYKAALAEVRAKVAG
jgi:hypothetical protein